MKHLWLLLFCSIAWAQYQPPSGGGGGSGTVTQIVCNGGLSGGTITVSGTCAVAAGGVTNAMLAGSIAASKLVGTDITTVGTIGTGTWQGTPIANAFLANSALTIAGHSVSLGGTQAIACGDLSNSVATCSSLTAGTPAFSSVTAGTNTGALLIGTGGSLGTSGTGTISSTTAASLANTATGVLRTATTIAGPTTWTTLDSNVPWFAREYNTNSFSKSIMANAGGAWPFAVEGEFLNLPSTAASLSSSPGYAIVEWGGITNTAFSNGVSGAAIGGERGQLFCAVDNCGIFGITLQLTCANTDTSNAGYTAHICNRSQGLEIDTDNDSSSSGTVYGALIVGNSIATPATAYDAVRVQSLTGSLRGGTAVPFNNTLVSDIGAATHAIWARAVAAGNSQNSQDIILESTFSNGAALQAHDYMSSAGSRTFNVPTGGTYAWQINGSPAAALTSTYFAYPSYAGAAPTADGQQATNTTTHTNVFGSNGTTYVQAIAVSGAGNTATTCSNQALTAISGIAAPTCSTLTGSYFGSSITARASLGNASASAAAPSFGTTADQLAYQVAEIPSQVEVCSAGGTGCSSGAFTTSGSGTALEAITGLSWTFPANTALNIPFDCHITYHQNTATANVNFGYNNATVAQTNLTAHGTMQTTTSAPVPAVLVNSAPAANTSTAFFTAASPSAITTNWNVDIWGYIEQPSNGSSSLFTIRTSTATQGDTVTVVRGSYCHIGI